jgi:hypothetical protein
LPWPPSLGEPLAMIFFTRDNLKFAGLTTIIERWWLNA